MGSATTTVPAWVCAPEAPNVASLATTDLGSRREAQPPLSKRGAALPPLPRRGWWQVAPKTAWRVPTPSPLDRGQTLVMALARIPLASALASALTLTPALTLVLTLVLATALARTRVSLPLMAMALAMTLAHGIQPTAAERERLPVGLGTKTITAGGPA
jgi:hypothetical protein